MTGLSSLLHPESMKLLLFLLVPGFSFAGIISPDQYSTIAEVDSATQARLVQGCNDLNFLMGSTKEKCLELAKEGRYTPAVVTACLQEKSKIANCLSAAKDLTIPEAVVKGCALSNLGKGDEGDVGACMRYFRASSSIFDEDAASFCLSKERNFLLARRCLNAIRDHDIDMAELKKCGEKSGAELLKENVLDCVDKVAAAAPLKTDAICTRKTSAKKSGGAGSTGTR